MYIGLSFFISPRVRAFYIDKFNTHTTSTITTIIRI